VAGVMSKEEILILHLLLMTNKAQLPQQQLDFCHATPSHGDGWLQ